MSDSHPLIDPEKLRQRRIDAGLNQSGLAALTGIHQTHITRLENGDRGTTAKTLGKIASALGCRIRDLMLEKAA